MTRILSILLLLAFLPAAQAQQKPLVLNVWPGKAPGETGAIGPEKVLEDKPSAKPVKRITNVTKPTVSVFIPDKQKEPRPAVLIAPGGGYSILAWDLEGEEVAAWLDSIGVTGIVLKYRVPRRPGDAKDAAPLGALQDAQRAMSLVRSKASAWKIDPKRIGMLGFSAGGHLTAATTTNFDKRSYQNIDSVDDISCRPDFAVLIYPAYLVEKGTTQLRPDIRVSKETPPLFFAHASNDGVSVENSIGMYLAGKRAGVPVELHAYSTGGHGFGLRKSDQPCSTWPARCADWLRVQGILKK